VVDAHIPHFLSNPYNRFNILGFDTEWHFPDTQAATASRCATLHLGDGKSCRIIQLSCLGRVILESLVNFLRLPNYTFVGFGIKDNVAKLEKYYGETQFMFPLNLCCPSSSSSASHCLFLLW
jgi:hypothetical protein